MRPPLLLRSPGSAEPRTPRPGSLHSSHFCSSPGEVAARGSTISSSNSWTVTLHFRQTTHLLTASNQSAPHDLGPGLCQEKARLLFHLTEKKQQQSKFPLGAVPL